jgi:hypothetical protein
MTKVKHIYCYDFDKTFIRTAEKVEGKKKYHEVTGLTFPKEDWWQSPISLDMNIFYPTRNEFTYQEYKKSKAVPDAMNFLVTGRVLALKDHVIKILDFHDLKFDRYYLKDGNDTFIYKLNKFKSFLEEFPELESLTIYDDRVDHLYKFKEWADNEPRGQYVDIKIIEVS